MPHPQVGWGNTGDLTKYSVKFPSTGAKKLVKTPPQGRDLYKGFDLPITVIVGSANCHHQV